MRYSKCLLFILLFLLSHATFPFVTSRKKKDVKRHSSYVPLRLHYYTRLLCTNEDISSASKAAEKAMSILVKFLCKSRDITSALARKRADMIADAVARDASSPNKIAGMDSTLNFRRMG